MISNLESFRHFGKTQKLVSFHLEDSSGSRTVTHAGGIQAAMHKIGKSSLLTGDSETSRTAYLNSMMGKNSSKTRN